MFLKENIIVIWNKISLQFDLVGPCGFTIDSTGSDNSLNASYLSPIQ